MAPMIQAFVADMHRFAKREGIEIVHFQRGQRKDEDTQRRLKQFQAAEGVLYIGVAQEKFAGFRVMKKISAHTGSAFPWLYRSTVMCNQYYFYLSQLFDGCPKAPNRPIASAMRQLEQACEQLFVEAKLAA